MNSGKDMERKELQEMVDEYLRNGGKIQQIPIGVTGDIVRFHGHKTVNNKVQLYGFSNKRKKTGFHRERIKLSQS